MKASSPHKSNTIYLSVSQRTSFKRCRWAWSWRYLRGLEPKVASDALRLGLLVHQSMQFYMKPGLKRGVKPWITFAKLYEQELHQQMKIGFRDDDGTWADAATLGEAMLKGYVDTYDGNKEWKVLCAEQVFELRITPRIYAIGVIDSVWQHRGTKAVVMVDYKTAAQIATRHLTMDDQAGQYFSFGVPWLQQAGILHPGTPVACMMFDFMRKALPKEDDRPMNKLGERLNKDGSVSKNQGSQAPLFERYKAYRDEAAQQSMRERTMDEAREIILARRGKLKLLKSPSRDNCGFCNVREVCELHDVGADWNMMARATLKRRDGTKVGQLQDAIDYERSK